MSNTKGHGVTAMPTAILTCDLNYRHDLTDDESATLCGIDLDDEAAQDIPICCPCGEPDCSKQADCPTCLALKEGKVN